MSPKNYKNPAHRRIIRKKSVAAQSPDKGPSSPLIDKINQELYKRNAELAVRNKTLALLRELDALSMGTLGMHDMASEIAREISEKLGYDIVSFAVVDKEKNVLRWIAISSVMPAVKKNLSPFANADVHHPLDSSVKSVSVLTSKKPLIVSDLHDVFPKNLAGMIEKTTKLRDTLMYPLWYGNTVLGLLTVSANRDLRDLSRYEQESLSGIIGLTVLALYKAQIYQDLQKTSAELQNANDRLAQVDKAKSEFLSIASHQLYTPLTAIKGYLSMVQEGDFGALPEKQKPIIDIIRQSSDRLIDLIKDLLDVSRIESGRLELSLVSVDFVKLTRDLVTELQPNAEKKKLTLTFYEPEAALSHVVADEQRLRQVLLNTIDNSIKYTPEGRVDVRVKREGEEIIFSVSDTGKGIAPEEIGRLFTKFTRVGGADRFHTEGSGLGLYVARQIVREHRGEIWAESPGRGKGSTFLVKLPIEGSKNSHTAGEKVTVGIKAAEVGEAPKNNAK